MLLRLSYSESADPINLYWTCKHLRLFHICLLIAHMRSAGMYALRGQTRTHIGF